MASPLHLFALVGWLYACQGAFVEVVVAHYSEDLSWTDAYKSPSVEFKVYSKAKVPPYGSVILPNIGREAHTYLYHIVNKYQSLATWTVFTQGARPSWGYHGGGEFSGHLSDTVEFSDYLKPFPDGRDSLFVLNSVSQFPSAMQANRLGFMIKNLKGSAVGKSMCPPGGANGWTSWWWDQGHPQLWGKASDTTMLQFYHRFIAGDDDKDEHKEELTLAFAQGARFAVSRERVHARPREYYAVLLEQLSRSVAPMEGYWMEAAWYDVFHPEALQSKHPPCDLPRLPPLKGALSISAMQAEALHRAQEGGFLDDLGEFTDQIRMLSAAYGNTTNQGNSTRNAVASLAASPPLRLQVPFAVLALAASGAVAPMCSA